MVTTPPGMISVEDARERILSVVPLLDVESKPLDDALGQVLAADVRAPFSIPPLDNTSMDGYAVKSADTTGASGSSPVTLNVIGEVGAGHLFQGEVGPGAAVRIMTGATIPDGADAIVPFEETDEPEGRNFGAFAKGRPQVGILKAAKLGANIRRTGEDVQEGAVILQSGALLGPAQIGVLASLGLDEVPVYRRPVIALISTGDELLALGQPRGPGQIYDSNAHSVAAQVREAGGIPRLLGIARDTVEELTAKLHDALDADLIITSAGVSRGDYDVVKDVLLREGEVGFWTVNMRPGKPLAFGTFEKDGRRVPHIGLPGNPVSSMVAFELFGRAAIFKMMGRTGWERPTLEVTLEERITSPDLRRHYNRCIVRHTPQGYIASTTGSQSSGVLTSMAQANALAICPEGIAAIEAGQKAQALLLAPVVESV